MADVSERVRERLKALSRKFSKQLPEKLAEIKDVYEQALFTSGNSKEFREFRNLVHRLAGSGSTFGFHTVSSLSKKLERILDKIIETNSTISQKHANIITSYLAELQKESEKHISNEKESAEKTDEVPLESLRKRVVCFFKRDRFIPVDFSDQLGFFGFPIRHLEGLDEIEEIIGEGRQVIVIMDARCLMDLVGVQERLKELKDRFPMRLHVIFVSGIDDFETRLEAVRTGGDAFFTHPVEISRLIDKMDSLSARIDHEPYHILIVDDDKEQVSYYALILQQSGMITSVASDPKNVFQVLIESKPELVLMDMYMPGASGIELAQLIRQQEAFVGIPIVFLSVETNIEKQLDAISHGGDDFLVKPIDPDHLIKSVTIRAERTRNMRFFMERDSLTGLLNHSNLIESLNNEVQRAERIGNELCFAMIDIDHFKSVNDRFGHLTGDRVLKGLARLLQERLRKTDIIGRYGGEEFGVILFNTGPKDAASILNEIRESFSQIRQQAGEQEFYVTFSCGIAGYPKVKNANKLGDVADKALYEAKENGRNKAIVSH